MAALNVDEHAIEDLRAKQLEHDKVSADLARYEEELAGVGSVLGEQQVRSWPFFLFRVGS